MSLVMNGVVASVNDKRNEKNEIMRQLQIFYQGRETEKAVLYDVVDFGGKVGAKQGDKVSLPVYVRASQGPNGKVYLNFVVESSHLPDMKIETPSSLKGSLK